MRNERPLIGVGVLIYCGEKILLQKRLAGHSPNVWAFPGGHLEYGETFDECALRETREECGFDLRVKRPRFLTAVNTVYPEENKHYVVIFMQAQYVSGAAHLTEPEKGTDWCWFHVDNLPHPLMQGVQALVDQSILTREGLCKLSQS